MQTQHTVITDCTENHKATLCQRKQQLQRTEIYSGRVKIRQKLKQRQSLCQVRMGGKRAL